MPTVDEGIELTPKGQQPLLNFVPSTVRFQNICYNVDGKDILNNVSGRFKHGRLVALMGPSGAGKSSLLNVLAGAGMVGLSGEVTINGEPVEENDPRSVYVEQDCPLLSYLTVRGTMTYAVDMKMSRRTSRKEKRNKIKEILSLLGLDTCARTLVKNISGGEQKRLSVAVELITNPAVMLLDEPTSGLDSASSMQLVSHLKSLAMGGRTIVCTIHQPASSLFQLFDDVFLLVKGRCLYSGPVEGMIGTLEEGGFRCPEYYNPADFAIEVLLDADVEAKEAMIAKTSAEMRELFEAGPSSPSLQRGDGMVRRYQVPFWYQFLVLLKRSAISSTKDEFYFRIRFGFYIAIGLVFGVVHYNIGNDASKVIANIGCFFQLFNFVYFVNSIAVINYAEEADVSIKEIANNWYSRDAYFFSKLLSDLPMQILCPTVMLPSLYYLTNQPLEFNRIAMLWVIFLLGGLVGQCIGLLVGVCFGPKTRNFILGNTCIVAVLFSGYVITSSNLAWYLRPLCYLSFQWYMNQGSLLALYGNGRGSLKCDQVYCYLKKPSVILEEFDVQTERIEDCLWPLVTMVGVLYVLTYVAFVVRLRRMK
ncbi:ATP-binding cassette sub-family G member 4 [Culex quinquefasciatus]|uniref:ATP-binding cassette sub-family G member 4 n=1 Tax=Culex quinquefasciatus TaxID=7176 RepID=UPI0018E3683D|nr:ATP-binding cassette sub-family G member 4 [Culex quinquefasciatus]